MPREAAVIIPSPFPLMAPYRALSFSPLRRLARVFADAPPIAPLRSSLSPDVMSCIKDEE